MFDRLFAFSLPFGPCLTVEAAGFGHWLLLESITLFPSSTLSSKTLHASSSLDVKWLHVPQLHSSQSGHHIVCCDSVSSGGVFAGLAGALLARGADPEQAAC